jgi:hypothetical protein
VQVVVSDGLNANAINENLRSVLPGVRRELLAAGFHISETDIVIENGRVRAGYHAGSLLEAEMIIHFHRRATWDRNQYAFGILNLWLGPQGATALGVGGGLRPLVDYGCLWDSSPR